MYACMNACMYVCMYARTREIKRETLCYSYEAILRYLLTIHTLLHTCIQLQAAAAAVFCIHHDDDDDDGDDDDI